MYNDHRGPPCAWLFGWLVTVCCQFTGGLFFTRIVRALILVSRFDRISFARFFKHNDKFKSDKQWFKGENTRNKWGKEKLEEILGNQSTMSLKSFVLMFFLNCLNWSYLLTCFAFLFSPTKVEVHLLWSSTSFIGMKKRSVGLLVKNLWVCPRIDSCCSWTQTHGEAVKRPISINFIAMADVSLQGGSSYNAYSIHRAITPFIYKAIYMGYNFVYN